MWDGWHGVQLFSIMLVRLNGCLINQFNNLKQLNNLI